MNKKLSGFIAGMVTMAVIGGVTVTALAAGSFTITVDPVNIQVNGQVFAPKDVKGNDVPVFAYNGTTYAPVRALGEAYGLNVGYDGTSGLVAVTDPAASPVDPEPTDPTTPPAFSWTEETEALYQEFSGMWKVVKTNDSMPPYRILTLQYQGEDKAALKAFLLNCEDSVIYALTERYAIELFTANRDAQVLLINYKYLGNVVWDDKYFGVPQTINGVETQFRSGFYRNTVLPGLGQ